jgi:hypothetical protein
MRTSESSEAELLAKVPDQLFIGGEWVGREGGLEGIVDEAQDDAEPEPVRVGASHSRSPHPHRIPPVPRVA